MRYGIFSDVHANWEALTAVIRAFEKEGIDHYFCAGDIVGYGANPQECIDLIQKLNADCVAGNHDWAVVDKFDTDNFNHAAKQAIFWTKEHVRVGDRDFLKYLPLIFKNNDLILVHGTLPFPQNFEYLLYGDQVQEMFNAMERSLCFIGHTHVPQIIFQQEGKVRLWDASDIKIGPQSKYIVNVGSVGQPRDGNPMAAYCIYDTAQREISIRRVNYAIAAAHQKIIQAGLPRILADRLSEGK